MQVPRVGTLWPAGLAYVLPDVTDASLVNTVDDGQQRKALRWLGLRLLIVGTISGDEGCLQAGDQRSDQTVPGRE